jgi:hypothetical protein
METTVYQKCGHISNFANGEMWKCENGEMWKWGNGEMLPIEKD